MEYATHYDIGDRKRDGGINEDSVALSVFEQGHRDGVDEDLDAQNRSAAVFALADGAGGHDAGDVASYIATTAVCEYLSAVAVRTARSDPSPFEVDVPDDVLPERPERSELQGAIEEAIVRAHREVLEFAGASESGAYTTIVAGIAIDGELHFGWVGDSRAYLVNHEHDSIELLTRDHGVVQELHEQGEIDDVEAYVHPRGNEITRALGGTGETDPETATVPVDTASVPLYAEDVILITSDGLIDAQTDAPELYERYVEADRSDEVGEEVREAVVTDEEIRDLVLNTDTLEGAAERLLTMANDRGGKDNLSALLAYDPALESTPDTVPVRSVDTEPVENRETIIVPDE